MRPPFASLFVFGALLVAPVAAKALVVPINHSARVSISGTASSVVVGNAAIADVTVVDSHTVYVTGKAYGATDLVVLDPHGRTLFNGDITVSAAGGSVSVYRGAVKTSVACDPGCTESTEVATGDGRSLSNANSASPASLQATSGGAMMPQP
jgi:Flp pilus assembly secretin CpaC